MGKKFKVNYDSSSGVIEIIVRDPTGRKEASFKSNLDDRKSITRIGNILRTKYNVDLSFKKDFFEF
jgi:hypothetical protein